MQKREINPTDWRTVGLGVVAVTIALTTSALAQNVDWRLHNLDLAGSRYSEMDQIDRSNVHTLTPRWLFQHGVIDGVSNQTTPVVVDGVMYVTDSRGSGLRAQRRQRTSAVDV